MCSWMILMKFTFDRYKELLSILKEDNLNILPVKDYLSERPGKNFLILRHDVDRNPQKSLKIAEIEAEFDVKSTYYFRYPHTFDTNIIQRISEMGHEIGYHYEVFSKAKGDREKAIEMFNDEIKKFQKIVDLKTACMHGSPTSEYDNRNLWEFIDFEKYGLLGDAFFSVDDFEIYYFTDTGRRWDDKYNLRDKYEYNDVEGVESTEDLLNILKKRKIKKLYITTHPERWGKGVFDSIYLWTKDFVFNMGKKVIQLYR